MPFRQQIENNPVLWLIGTAVTAFVAGFGAYRAILSVARQETVQAGSYLPRAFVDSYYVSRSAAESIGRAANSPRCADLGIEITSPGPNETIALPYTLAGPTKPLPSGYNLWLFATSAPGSRPAYWPRSPVQIVGNRWSLELSAGSFRSAGTKYLAVFLVGRDGEALLRTYKTAMTQLAPPDSPWPPLIDSTSDMLRCTPGLLVRSK